MSGQKKYDELAIVGLGNVGELAAFSAMTTGKFNQIYIYNRDSRIVNNRSKSEAKHRNLTDASPWYNTQIIKCDSYDELPSDALTLICIKEGYDYRYVPANRIREVTSRKDAPLMRKIGEAYAKKEFTGEVFMVSNPISPMSYLFQHYSGIDESKIHPVGSILDTARYIKFIRGALKDQNANVDAIVIGEHGPSMVFLKSSSTVNGRPLSSYGIDLDAIEGCVKAEGPITANTIGYTNAGIVASLLKLFNIVSSENCEDRFPFGLKYEEAFVELPVIKSCGIYQIKWDNFDSREKRLLEVSVRKIAESNEKILQDAKERQQRRIMIVDDEPGEPETLAASLEEALLDDKILRSKNDFHFSFVYGGEELVEAVKKDPIGYDLIIADQRMPNMSGLDAILKAREYQPELDCIILSGKSEMNDLQKMVNYDGLTFILKPFFNPEIMDLLRQPNYQIFKRILEKTQQKIA